MKYIIVYKSKRGDKRRHVYMEWGRRVYYNSILEAEGVIEELRQSKTLSDTKYNLSIMTANFKPIKGGKTK